MTQVETVGCLHSVDYLACSVLRLVSVMMSTYGVWSTYQYVVIIHHHKVCGSDEQSKRRIRREGLAYCTCTGFLISSDWMILIVLV